MFLKPSKPCHVGIHWIALDEYSQMSTHMPGFRSCPFFLRHFELAKLATSSIKVKVNHLPHYRWTWIWRTTVRQIFAYDGRYAWSQSDAYHVFVICIRRILHMTDQFSWSHWVCHIQVHLYNKGYWINNFFTYWYNFHHLVPVYCAIAINIIHLECPL